MDHPIVLTTILTFIMHTLSTRLCGLYEEYNISKALLKVDLYIITFLLCLFSISMSTTLKVIVYKNDTPFNCCMIILLYSRDISHLLLHYFSLDFSQHINCQSFCILFSPYVICCYDKHNNFPITANFVFHFPHSQFFYMLF